MNAPVGPAFWEEAIKKAVVEQTGKIIDEEAEAAAERVRARVSTMKAELIDRVVERLKVVHKQGPEHIGFEVVISL